MEIKPILASLRKHRIPAILIVLEIALACAVLCNAIFMIGQRVASIRLPNAIDQQGVVAVNLRGTDDKLAGSDIPRNLAALRGIAGVKDVAITNSLPLSHNNWGWSFGVSPDDNDTNQKRVNVSLYFIGAGGDKALGLHVVQGRFFKADEFAGSRFNGAPLPETHAVVMTRTAAQHYWPGQSALGKTIYSSPFSYTVVGVVDDVLRPNAYTPDTSKSYDDVYLPMSAAGSKGMLGSYILRCAPGDRERVLREAQQKLMELNPNGVVHGVTYTDIRDSYFADTRSMVWMLILVCAVMVAVTAFGIVGLTSFWVGQRRRQIGIRRAVGATRTHILQYFQTENFLLSSLGVGVGMVLAYGINVYLMHHYEMARMPWFFFPVGAIALWAIGQASVLGPALRAAAVPPVVATRAE